MFYTMPQFLIVTYKLISINEASEQIEIEMYA